MRTTLRLGIVAMLLLGSVVAVAAQDLGRPAFETVWQRTDLPVQQGVAAHSWVWGPEPFTPVMMEMNVDSPDQSRAVQYLDKSRMEINDPNAPQTSPWYVTNGLLVREMVDGQVQVGNADFIPLAAASIAVAGDPDNDFPTYADMAQIVNAQPRFSTGDYVDQQFTADGFVRLPQFANAPATQIVHIEQGYGIPRVFWDYLNRGGTVFANGRFVRAEPLFNWLYVTGYPIGDAYWLQARVGGIERDVLFQAFERRVLTFTPANPTQYQVEMGNVGRHYYQWRYEDPFVDQQGLIAVPEQGAQVTSPLTIRGFEAGAAFEANVVLRLRAADGTVLAQEPTVVMRPDIGVPGPFEATLRFDAPQQATNATIEAVTISPRDGAETIIASRQVRLQAANEAQAPVERARNDLAARLNIPAANITVVSTEAVDWRNAALECPAPNQAYATVITPGYRMVLEAQGQQYEYRSDARTERLVLCQDGQPAPPVDAAEIAIPAAGAQVTLPLHILARLGEPDQEVTAVLRWQAGDELTRTVRLLRGADGRGLLIASMDWLQTIPPMLATQPATLELRGQNGQTLAQRQITVLGMDDPNTQLISVYWLIGEALEAEQRRIVRTPAIGTAALEELLWGPPPRNFAGFSTALPTPEEVLNFPGRGPDWGPRVTLRSLVIENGVATADFSRELRAYGGGSARVQAIRDQITRTLQQFPTVNEVRIAIEGETEGVLQP